MKTIEQNAKIEQLANLRGIAKLRGCNENVKRMGVDQLTKWIEESGYASDLNPAEQTVNESDAPDDFESVTVNLKKGKSKKVKEVDPSLPFAIGERVIYKGKEEATVIKVTPVFVMLQFDDETVKSAYHHGVSSWTENWKELAAESELLEAENAEAVIEELESVE
jgi:hypothetical protein